MLKALSLILTFVLPCSAWATTVDVCEIRADVSDPDPVWPWLPPEDAVSLGSGWILADGWILTAHHVVKNATSIQAAVRGPDASSATARKYELVAASTELDLALLREADSASQDWPAVQLNVRYPSVGDPLQASGFVRGEAAAAPLGKVQGAQMGFYPAGAVAMQILTDGAPTQGLSGGPVTDASSSIVGIFIGSVRSAPLVVPNEIIQLFLEDASDGVVDGIWYVPDRTQPVDGAALLRWAGLDDPHGLLITEARPNGCHGESGLRSGDVLLSIDGFEIDALGYVTGPDGLRSHWLRVVAISNGTLRGDIVRDRERQRIDIKAMRGQCYKFPFEESRDELLVVGPYIFAHATRAMAERLETDYGLDYLRAVNASILWNRGDIRRTPDERAVTLIYRSPSPSHSAKTGLRLGWVLSSVNHVPVRNVPHAFEVMGEQIRADVEFLVLRFADFDAPLIIVPTSTLHEDSIGTRELMDGSKRKVLFVDLPKSSP